MREAYLPLLWPSNIKQSWNEARKPRLRLFIVVTCVPPSLKSLSSYKIIAVRAIRHLSIFDEMDAQKIIARAVRRYKTMLVLLCQPFYRFLNLICALRRPITQTVWYLLHYCFFHLEVLGQPSLQVRTRRKPYILSAGILEHGLTRSFASDNWRDLERSKKLATWLAQILQGFGIKHWNAS